MLAVTMAAAATVLGLGEASASATMVTVTLDGSAKGSVTSDPAGINCSNVPGAEASDCSFDFPLNFAKGVVLSAVGADGAALKSWTGTAGGTCSGAANPCETAPTLFDPLAATATFAPKPGKPLAVTGAANDLAFPSAVLSGTVNPNSADFSVADCYFEYGTSTDYGLKDQCHPGPPGPGTDAVPVTGRAGLLASGTTYHYRVVAVSAGGTSVGEDRTFTSPMAPTDPCPNAAIRAQQGAIAQRLPACGAYELVSPPSTAGEPVLTNAVGDTGNDALFASVGGFADVENLMNLGALYRAHRTADGWSTSAVGGPPPEDFPFFSTEFEWTTDWWRTAHPLTLWAARPASDPSDYQIQLVGKKGGPWAPVSPSLAAGLGASVIATSTDLSGVVFRGNTRLQLTDGTVDERTGTNASLTVSKRKPDGTIDLRQVAQQNGATFLPSCALQLGTSANGITRGAVARDGLTRIVFSTSGTRCTTADHQRVWVSEPFSASPDVFDASASQCTTDCGTPQRVAFVGGSLDATRLYMTTTEKLLDSDTQSGADLYEYDFRRPAGERLRLVTGSDTPANVLGAVAVTDDGDRVYFVARGQLSGAITGDTDPVLGAPNLYVRTTDASGGNSMTRFIGTLSESDSSLWGSISQSLAMTPDGRYLAITSQAALTADKQTGDTLPDVYRIDGDTGDIVRAWTDSPEHNGARRQAGALVTGRSAGGSNGSRQRGLVGRRVIADDGSAIFFSSAEPLASSDVNDKDDAFVWRASTKSLTMVSDGRDPEGVTPAGMSADGTTFFFNTSSRLVAQQTSTSVSLLAVRQDGGFPVPDSPAVPCVGEACQGPPSGSPLLLAGIGSTTVLGNGNAVPEKAAPPKKPAKVRVGKVKAVRGTSTWITVKVPEKGKIRTSGSGLRRAHKTAKKAGSYRVTAKLSKRAQRTLKRKLRVRVRVRVRFTPAKGKSSSVRVRVTFRIKHQHRSSSRAQRRASVLSSAGRKGR